MSRVPNAHATRALQFLCDRVGEVHKNLQAQNIQLLLPDADEISESGSPVMNSFLNAQGSRAVLKMTNFAVRQFHRIDDRLHVHIMESWNYERGYKTQVQPKNAIFMLLTVLKHGGRWDLTAKPFKFRTPTFEQLIQIILNVITEFAYKKLIEELAQQWSMEKLSSSNKSFQSFPYICYATDVTFQ